MADDPQGVRGPIQPGGLFFAYSGGAVASPWLFGSSNPYITIANAGGVSSVDYDIVIVGRTTI